MWCAMRRPTSFISLICRSVGLLLLLWAAPVWAQGGFFGSNNAGGSSSGGNVYAGLFFTATNASVPCPSGATYADFLIVGGSGGGAGCSSTAAGSGGGGTSTHECMFLCANAPFNVVVGPAGAAGAAGSGGCTNAGSGTASTVTDTATNACGSNGGGG